MWDLCRSEARSVSFFSLLIFGRFILNDTVIINLSPLRRFDRSIVRHSRSNECQPSRFFYVLSCNRTAANSTEHELWQGRYFDHVACMYLRIGKHFFCFTGHGGAIFLFLRRCFLFRVRLASFIAPLACNVLIDQGCCSLFAWRAFVSLLQIHFSSSRADSINPAAMLPSVCNSLATFCSCRPGTVAR